VSTRNGGPEPLRFLAVLTGQGALWDRMGAELVSASAAARDGLPGQVATAAFSQLLYTAVQVVLLDLLRAAGVGLTAALGYRRVRNST